MDGRGGCCIARYGGGSYDMSKVNRIMLRFRPIAPKPATGGSGSPTESSGGEPFTRVGKGKRKYSRENGSVNKRCNYGRKRDRDKTESVVTLPLLPDSPARSSPQPCPQDKEGRNTNTKLPTWLGFDKRGDDGKNQVVPSGGGSADRTVVVMPQAVRVVGSSVTVECVTDTWVDVDGLGSTDGERKVNLGRDTCPGFISDVFGRVTWTNEAYKKMVGGQEEGEGEEMVVWLVMKVPVTVTLTDPAFTCRVRLQYSIGREKSSVTLPCDVWKMDGGGFAWKLDVKAALSLGRSLNETIAV